MELKSRFPGNLMRAVAAGTVMALAGCTTEPPYYGPKDSGPVGYTDQQLAANRYRVTYTGSYSTSRETVENFLLLRAAEVTLAAGYPAFMFDTRDTKSRTTYYSTFTGWPGWRGYGWYWHSWPYDLDEESRPVTRYEAYAEIVMLTPAQAKQEVTAIDANDVIARLRPPPPPAKS